MNEINRILFKLKFYKGKVSYDEFDVKNLPKDVVYNDKTGDFIKIENMDGMEEEIDRFLKVKYAYNFNVIKNCVITGTVFFIILVCFILFYIARYL